MKKLRLWELLLTDGCVTVTNVDEYALMYDGLICSYRTNTVTVVSQYNVYEHLLQLLHECSMHAFVRRVM